MDKQFCKYHPAVAARWYCPRCRLALCHDCATSSDGITAPSCAICRQSLQAVSVQNHVEPFWRRLAAFFLFPASFPTVLYLFIFAAATAFLSIEIFGLLIGFVVYFLFINYAYTVLDMSAHGCLDQLNTTTRGFFYHPENAVKQLIMFFILGGLNFLAYDVASIAGLQVSAIISLALFPAISLQLVKHHSLLKMFSFREIQQTFVSMRRAYWLLCLFLLMLFIGGEMLMSILPDSVSTQMNLAIQHFVVFYLLLIMFTMIGYSFYQFHDRLGLAVGVMDSGVDQDSEREAKLNESLKRINILIKEGLLSEAAGQLASEIKKNPGNLAAWDRYFKVLVLEKDVEHLTEFSREYMNYLIHQENLAEATRVFLEAQKIIPQLKPKTGAQAFALAEQLRKHGHAGLALNLLNNMHKEYRGYDGIAKAYMLAAQILCEQFGEDSKAKKILNFIIKKYPQSRYAHEASDYLKVVDRLAVR